MALGTALTDKYRYNSYLRGTITIVLLQVLLTILIVLAFGFALRYQQESTLAVITQGTDDVNDSIAQVRQKTLDYTLLGLVLLTIFFGYLTARFAFRPMKDSLEFQKRFIGNMAHELRTPLAIIKTNTEVALMEGHVPPSINDTLRTTSEELDRISETINNLLSFNTMIRPSRIAYTRIDLVESARIVVERHQALAQSRGIKLLFKAGGHCPIRGNATGMEQVFTNLIKNALNYTPKRAGKTVTVELLGEGDRIKAIVSDTGIGIAKKDLIHIFQPFFRADTSRTRGVGGGTSGLGLAIVNEIVKAHQGRIFVRSAVNRGTAVEISFPKFADAGEDARSHEEDSTQEASLEVP